MRTVHQIGRQLKQVYDLSLSFFYPEVCQLCHELTASPKEGFICQSCIEANGGIRPIRPPFCDHCGLPFEGDISGTFECGNCHDLKLKFHSARSAVRTGATILELIHRYKYQRHLWFEPLFTDLLATAFATHFPATEIDLIVPIPLHKNKQRDRGFNQSIRLSRRLSKTIGVPLATKALERTRPTETQTRLSRKKRIENVHNAFSSGKHAELVKGKRILLIDDIMTTGATASACPKALKALKAEEVHVLTISRGG